MYNVQQQSASTIGLVHVRPRDAADVTEVCVLFPDHMSGLGRKIDSIFVSV